MTVGELEQRMDSPEVTEWLAIFTLEHDEMEAARKGLPSPRDPFDPTSPDEAQRMLELAFPVTE